MKPATRSLNLPKPIAAYFTADKGDGEAVSQCFTENAVVKDEGHTHKGRAAIKEWKADASAKYEYTSEPFACEEKDEKDGRHQPSGWQLSRQSRWAWHSSVERPAGDVPKAWRCCR